MDLLPARSRRQVACSIIPLIKSRHARVRRYVGDFIASTIALGVSLMVMLPCSAFWNLTTVYPSVLVMLLTISKLMKKTS